MMHIFYECKYTNKIRKSDYKKKGSHPEGQLQWGEWV